MCVCIPCKEDKNTERKREQMNEIQDIQVKTFNIHVLVNEMVHTHTCGNNNNVCVCCSGNDLSPDAAHTHTQNGKQLRNRNSTLTHPLFIRQGHMLLGKRQTHFTHIRPVGDISRRFSATFVHRESNELKRETQKQFQTITVSISTVHQNRESYLKSTWPAVGTK